MAPPSLDDLVARVTRVEALQAATSQMFNEHLGRCNPLDCRNVFDARYKEIQDHFDARYKEIQEHFDARSKESHAHFDARYKEIQDQLDRRLSDLKVSGEKALQDFKDVVDTLSQKIADQMSSKTFVANISAGIQTILNLATLCGVLWAVVKLGAH